MAWFTAIPQPHRVIGISGLARETDPKAEASPRQSEALAEGETEVELGESLKQLRWY